VHLDDDVAAALQGYVREATAEDMQGGDEEAAPEEGLSEDMPETASIPKAINGLTTKIDRAIEKATSIALTNAKKKATNHFTASLKLPAQLREPVFKGLGDMMRAQYKASRGDRRSYNKLQAYEQEVRVKAPLGSNEGTNSQGGYAVIPEWFERVWDKARLYPDLLGMCDVRACSSQSLNIPYLVETSLQDSNRHGGVLAYWLPEGNTATSSYPTLGQMTLTKNTQVILQYVTNQLLEDESYDLEKFVAELAVNEFKFQQNYAVISGSGSSQPTGIMNASALITVTKESGQSAATVLYANCAKMFGRLYAPSRANAVFLMNPECMQILLQMAFTSGGSTSVFGGLTYNAHEEFQLQLFGRPVLEIQSLPQLGLPGDIILADLSQIVAIETPGMEVAISTDLQFATLQTAYRFVRRYDAKSHWASALTPYDGSSNTQSPFIVISSRGT